jgi:hypothetical protein
MVRVMSADCVNPANKKPILFGLIHQPVHLTSPKLPSGRGSFSFSRSILPIMISLVLYAGCARHSADEKHHK